MPNLVPVMKPSSEFRACENNNGRSASCTAATAPTPIAIARFRITYSSHRASGATRKPAKKWVNTASAENTPHRTILRVDGAFQAFAKYSNEAPERATSSMYSLASWEYQIMNGLSAANAAATSPARRETSSRPHR